MKILASPIRHREARVEAMDATEDEDWGDELAVRHVSKRARHKKSTVVVFDEKDRSDYLSGFRKRKNKRRDAALQKQLVKERQKRLQDRRERRDARRAKDTAGDENGGEGGQSEDFAEDEDEHTVNEANSNVAGTATYEDAGITTIVNVISLTGDKENGDVKLPRRHSNSDRHGVDRKNKAKMLKVAKQKLKKQKRSNPVKRSGKMTKRDKSTSKHSRAKNRKAKK